MILQQYYCSLLVIKILTVWGCECTGIVGHSVFNCFNVILRYLRQSVLQVVDAMLSQFYFLQFMWFQQFVREYEFVSVTKTYLPIVLVSRFLRYCFLLFGLSFIVCYSLFMPVIVSCVFDMSVLVILFIPCFSDVVWRW